MIYLYDIYIWPIPKFLLGMQREIVTEVDNCFFLFLPYLIFFKIWITGPLCPSSGAKRSWNDRFIYLKIELLPHIIKRSSRRI